MWFTSWWHPIFNHLKHTAHDITTTLCIRLTQQDLTFLLIHVLNYLAYLVSTHGRAVDVPQWMTIIIILITHSYLHSPSLQTTHACHNLNERLVHLGQLHINVPHLCHHSILLSTQHHHLVQHPCTPWRQDPTCHTHQTMSGTEVCSCSWHSIISSLCAASLYSERAGSHLPHTPVSGTEVRSCSWHSSILSLHSGSVTGQDPICHTPNIRWGLGKHSLILESWFTTYNIRLMGLNRWCTWQALQSYEGSGTFFNLFFQCLPLLQIHYVYSLPDINIMPQQTISC